MSDHMTSFSSISLFIGTLAAAIPVFQVGIKLFFSVTKSRIEVVKSALGCEYFDDNSQKALRNDYAAKSFQSVYGIYADEMIRKQIIKICTNSNGIINSMIIKSASSYMIFPDGVVKVQNDWKANGVTFCKYFILLLLVFSGFVHLLLSASSFHDNTELFYAFLFFGAAGVEFGVCKACFNARIIKKEIERQRKNPTP